MSEVVRMQIDCSTQNVERLRQLMADCGIESPTELINSALTFFTWAVAERRAGRVVASVDEKAQVYKEVDFPGATVAGRPPGS